MSVLQDLSREVMRRKQSEKPAQGSGSNHERHDPVLGLRWAMRCSGNSWAPSPAPATCGLSDCSAHSLAICQGG